jgi:hypothetical protein
MSGNQLANLSLQSKSKKKKKVVVKVGMVGDSQIGKTSLMVKYVEGNFNEDYIQTLGQFSPTLHERLAATDLHQQASAEPVAYASAPMESCSSAA